MWFKFDSASGRLATSNPIESISHQVWMWCLRANRVKTIMWFHLQVTKPLDAQNFKPTEMVFDRPVKLVRSAVGLRQNATAAAVPNKPAPGTILPNGYVMGEFGAYDPKIRKLQDFFSVSFTSLYSFVIIGKFG